MSDVNVNAPTTAKGCSNLEFSYTSINIRHQEQAFNKLSKKIPVPTLLRGWKERGRKGLPRRKVIRVKTK